MTSDLGGRVAPKISRPTGFYTTHPVKLGEAVKVGTLALIQGGELVDADPAAVASGGTPVVVDRGEHTIPEDGKTALDNRNGTDGEPVTGRVTNGEVFLFNTDTAVTTADEGTDVYILDNDTVQKAQPAGEPRVGHIVRVEDTNLAFVKVDGLS